MELFEETSGLKGPPEATLARRAKSYSDFYEVAKEYLNKEAKIQKTKDAFEIPQERLDNYSFNSRYEELEDDLLDASHQVYQYVL
jgi:hypothetical protein